MITGGVLVQFILPGTKFSSAVQVSVRIQTTLEWHTICYELFGLRSRISCLIQIALCGGVVFGCNSLELVPIITDEKITLL